MKLNKRIASILRISACVTGIICVAGVTGVVCVTGTGCVATFYGTARIEPGFHVNAGVGVGQFIGGSYEATSRYIGPRADVEVGYAFSHFFKTHLRAGGGWGWRSEEYVEGESPSRPEATLLDGAIGIQVSSPHHYPTPALRLEVGLGGVSTDLMFGIGEPEWLTLGTRVYFFKEELAQFYLPVAPFIGIHPLPHLSIFASPGTFAFYEDYKPLFSVGVGYKLK